MTAAFPIERRLTHGRSLKSSQTTAPAGGAAPTLSQSRDIQQEHDAAAAWHDLPSMFRINIVFHDTLFAQCGNQHLVDEIALFGKKADAVRSLSMIQSESMKKAGHELRALREADREALVSLCRDHIQAAKNAYIAAYESRFPATRRSA